MKVFMASDTILKKMQKPDAFNKTRQTILLFLAQCSQNRCSINGANEETIAKLSVHERTVQGIWAVGKLYCWRQ